MTQFKVENTNVVNTIELIENNRLSRSFDGAANNLRNPCLGMLGETLLRKSSVDYSGSQTTGIAVRGDKNPSPRLVSNEICQASLYGGSPTNSLNLSDMCWAWGQFLDHELDITPEQHEGERLDMSTDDGGVNESFPGRTIPFSRSEFVEKNGVRQHPNNLSSFVDATNVYGTTRERAYALRTLDGTGKMKTVLADNGEVLMPYNTKGLSNAPSTSPTFFLAGDIRANENVLLASLHTLFVREHNRLCDYIRETFPDEDGKDEMIYQHARRIVSGIMQYITYEEFLPALLGSKITLGDYSDEVDPGITTEFSTAGYRLGHTMVSENLQVGPLNTDVISLVSAYFNPSYIQNNGVDSILQGASLKKMQEIDHIVVENLRSFLFGAPTSTTLLDLAALNIQRGRDHGLPGYNSVRQAYGLSTFSNFSELPMPSTVISKLSVLYDTPDDIDPWIGVIAENHESGKAVGPLAAAIITEQFTRLNTGDRYWYTNDVAMDIIDRTIITSSTLSDVLKRNTTVYFQDDVFHTL